MIIPPKTKYNCIITQKTRIITGTSNTISKTEIPTTTTSTKMITLTITKTTTTATTTKKTKKQ